MCRRRKDTQASKPSARSTPLHSRTTDPSSSSSFIPFTVSSTASLLPSDKSSNISSLSTLRDFLPDNGCFYSFQEISSATNNFLSERLSSFSANAWRCTLRDKDAVVIQQKFNGDESDLLRSLPLVCKAHHNSVVPLLGASIGGDQVYLVYEYLDSSSLADILRNPKTQGYKLFSSWVLRTQIAVDLAQGLEYIHHYTSAARFHNLFSSSTAVISYPQIRGKISFFGAFEIAGDKTSSSASSSELQKSDVFAFGVVLLELLSGEEPVKYIFSEESEDYARVSLVETAKEMMGSEERQRMIRRWVDPRLKDSYPVEVAEKMTELAVECLHETPEKRPRMDRVARKLSSCLLHSRAWADSLRVPEEISLYVGPR